MFEDYVYLTEEEMAELEYIPTSFTAEFDPEDNIPY